MATATATKSDVEEFIAQIPEPDEIRTRLCETLRQADLLKQLLRLANKRQRVADVRAETSAHA